MEVHGLKMSRAAFMEQWILILFSVWVVVVVVVDVVVVEVVMVRLGVLWCLGLELVG